MSKQQKTAAARGAISGDGSWHKLNPKKAHGVGPTREG
jgi:hypothetical protein